MYKVRRLRAMGSLCRQTAAYNPAERCRFVAEAEYWEHLAEHELAVHFEECNAYRFSDEANVCTSANSNDTRRQTIVAAWILSCERRGGFYRVEKGFLRTIGQLPLLSSHQPPRTRWWWSPRRYQLTFPVELPAEAPPELRRALVRTRVLCGSALHIRGKGWAAESTFSGVNSAQKRPLSWDPAFLCHSGDQQGARRQAGSVPCAWWHRPPP